MSERLECIQMPCCGSEEELLGRAPAQIVDETVDRCVTWCSLFVDANQRERRLLLKNQQVVMIRRGSSHCTRTVPQRIFAAQGSWDVRDDRSTRHQLSGVEEKPNRYDQTGAHIRYPSSVICRKATSLRMCSNRCSSCLIRWTCIASGDGERSRPINGCPTSTSICRK